MIEKLGTPVSVVFNGVRMQATHEAGHITDQADVNGLIIWHRVYGIMEGDRFIPLQTDDLRLEPSDIEELRAATTLGKLAGVYRNTDVKLRALAAEARRRAAPESTPRRFTSDRGADDGES